MVARAMQRLKGERDFARKLAITLKTLPTQPGIMQWFPPSENCDSDRFLLTDRDIPTRWGRQTSVA